MLSNLLRGLLMILTATPLLGVTGQYVSFSGNPEWTNFLLKLVDPDLLPEYRGAHEDAGHQQSADSTQDYGCDSAEEHQ